MSFFTALPNFARNDRKLIFRDKFLVFMTIISIIIAIIMRYLLPWADAALIEKGLMPSASIPYALHDLYPMLVSFTALYNGGIISGMVAGFLLLDEKDEGTLQALIVTPVPLHYYTIYRFGLASIFSAVVMFIMVYIINILLLPAWQLVLLCISASQVSTIVALFLVLTAQNKVQGFAMGKFTSIAGFTIMIGWFVPDTWQWLLGIFPPFLVHKAYWLALEGNNLWWLALAIGTLAQIIAIYFMAKKFNKLVYN
ncbi:MAG: hypothetical protein HRU29_09160 [Rhizobiales bacterium]|nr:hypothetical protein [Hyphomicrobiales bacterium]NRB14556.1 hypothetical protein [Hyphomicrobiales bacterium]